MVPPVTSHCAWISSLVKQDHHGTSLIESLRRPNEKTHVRFLEQCPAASLHRTFGIYILRSDFKNDGNQELYPMQELIIQ